MRPAAAQIGIELGGRGGGLHRYRQTRCPSPGRGAGMNRIILALLAISGSATASASPAAVLFEPIQSRIVTIERIEKRNKVEALVNRQLARGSWPIGQP